MIARCQRVTSGGDKTRLTTDRTPRSAFGLREVLLLLLGEKRVQLGGIFLAQTEKEDPQPHVLVTLGLLNLNPEA